MSEQIPDGCLGCNKDDITKYFNTKGIDLDRFIEIPRPRHAWKIDKAICPGCGNICSPKSIGKYHTCKKCGYEGVYTLRRILNGKTDYPNWNDVNLKLFLEALQDIGLLDVNE